MSKIEVDTIDTQSSTTLQVGDTNTSLIKIGKTGDTVEYPAGTTFTQSGTQNVTAGGAINVKSGGNITIDSGATITNNGTASGFSADLTNLNATNLTSGTVPDARFPSVLPAVSGANLTNIAGQLQWQSGIITASTASVGNNLGYWVNTTSNACVITLPGSAAVGDRIILTDYARTWGTNSVTINPNSLKFQGNVTPQPVYNTNGQSVDIVYSGATQGWIPNNDDDVTLETPQGYFIEYLLVGGGGGGGRTHGAGGGAGGYLTSTFPRITTGNVLTVTIGAGGAGASSSGAGTTGIDTTLTSPAITNLTANGGGGAGSEAAGAGIDGGSGGGGGGAGGGTGFAGGSGTIGQGNNGGVGYVGGGGGGGASAVGVTGVANGLGTGGAGLASSITGSSVTRAGGGGGSDPDNVAGIGGAGGAGGGGRGAGQQGAGVAGTVNTGGGGGGAQNAAGANGGSGVVILSMADADYSGTTTGSPTVATGVSGKTVITFNGDGSYTT